MPLRSSEKPTLVRVVLTERLQRGFPLYEKRQKAEIAFSVCVVAIIEAARPPSSESGGHAPSLGTTLSIQHQAAIAVNCVCERLCFYLDLGQVHPLARCVRRYHKTQESS